MASCGRWYWWQPSPRGRQIVALVRVSWFAWWPVAVARPWFGSLSLRWPLPVSPSPADDLARQPHTPPRTPRGAPPPPFLFTLPYFLGFLYARVLAGGLSSSTLVGQGMFRRWRLTPLHRQRGCRSSLLSSVCCHIGDFYVVSDLLVCPNALPLAALHRTNSRTLTMFTRFII